MPAVKKTSHAQEEKEETPMCANHPSTPAAHTTGSELHQPISLCPACLTRLPYMRQR